MFKPDYPFMYVKSTEEWYKGTISAILSIIIKLPVVIKIFVLSILSGRFTQVLLYNLPFIFIVLLQPKTIFVINFYTLLLFFHGHKVWVI